MKTLVKMLIRIGHRCWHGPVLAVALSVMSSPCRQHDPDVLLHIPKYSKT